MHRLVQAGTVIVNQRGLSIEVVVHGGCDHAPPPWAKRDEPNTDAADLAEARRQRDEWKALFDRVVAQRDEWERPYQEAANKRDAESARANLAEADPAEFRALGLTPDQLRLCMACCYRIAVLRDNSPFGLPYQIGSDVTMYPHLLAAWNAATKEAGR